MDSKSKSLPEIYLSKAAGDKVTEKYNAKANEKLNKKPKKKVTFKRVVDVVSFNEDWKMTVEKSTLRTEEEQRLNFLQRGDY